MPGFGTGPFGGGAFGEWPWAEQVLYYYVPNGDREDDTDGLLRAFLAGIGPSFDTIRRKIRDLDSLRDPLRVQTAYSDTRSLLLGRVLIPETPIEQRGVDGSVNSLREFNTPSGRFDPSSVGKLLTLTSTIQANNTTVRITSVPTPNSVTTEPPLLTDAGPMRWTVRPYAVQQTTYTVEVRAGDVTGIAPGWVLNDGALDFEVLGVQQIYSNSGGLPVSQLGTDGTVDISGRFYAPSAKLSYKDEGRWLVLSGSNVEANNGRFAIARMDSMSGELYAVVDGGPLAPDPGPFSWALLPFPLLKLSVPSPVLRGSIQAEGWDATVTAPDIVSITASSFSTTSVGRILTLRGSLLGNNGDFKVVEVLASNRVRVDGNLVSESRTLAWELRSPTIGTTHAVQAHTPSLIRYLAEDFGIEVDNQESEARQRSWVANQGQWLPKKGADSGYKVLARTAGFEATPLAMFWAGPYESVLPNDHRFETDGKVFTDLVPKVPLLDEVCPDAMSYSLGASFSADQFAWEPGYLAEFDVDIYTVTSATFMDHTVQAYGKFDAISALGVWRVTDSAGSSFYVESKPVSVGVGLYEFRTVSSVTPAPGIATLRYEAPTVLLPEYTAASRVHLLLEEDTIVEESGVAVERAFERTLRREALAIPRHVKVIPSWRRNYVASLSLQAECESGLEKFPTFLAPVSAFMDAIPGDDTAVDTFLSATISPGETTPDPEPSIDLGVGPQLYYTLDEADGSTVFASSGSWGTALTTFAELPQYLATGRVGAARGSAGGDMGLRAYPNIGLVPDMTTCLWVRSSTLAQPTNAPILTCNPYWSDTSRELQINALSDGHWSVTVLSLGTYYTFTTTDSAHTLPVGTWTHIGVSISGGSTLTVYRNGQAIGALTSLSISSTSNKGWTLGRPYGSSYATSFNGYFDEFRTYNETKSAEWFDYIYTNGTLPEGS